MTNSEYEKASVQAAESTAKFEGEHKLKELDGIINNIEKALSNLHAERRELVNRYDLNKCEHRNVCENTESDAYNFCYDCEKYI